VEGDQSCELSTVMRAASACGALIIAMTPMTREAAKKSTIMKTNMKMSELASMNEHW